MQRIIHQWSTCRPELAAALFWAADEEEAEFVAADGGLCDAARLEDLAVVRL